MECVLGTRRYRERPVSCRPFGAGGSSNHAFALLDYCETARLTWRHAINVRQPDRFQPFPVTISGSSHQRKLAHSPIKLFTRLIRNAHLEIVDSAWRIACIPGLFVKSGFLKLVDKPANFLTQQIIYSKDNAAGSRQFVYHGCPGVERIRIVLIQTEAFRAPLSVLKTFVPAVRNENEAANFSWRQRRGFIMERGSFGARQGPIDST